MARKLLYTAIAASVLCLLAGAPVAGQQKAGKNQMAEEAAKWVEQAGESFFLRLYGPDTTLVFSTDKNAGKGKTAPKFFVITKEEAAAMVQVLVNCGLWSRPDTLPGIQYGRFLAVGRSYEGVQQGIWRLGEVTDDVSSLVIIQHLLQTSKGERQQALKDWLSHGQGKKSK
jgi:hypothetical protein